MDTIKCMSISFNGVAGFVRKLEESNEQSLYRLITNQLDSKIDPEQPRAIDWDMIDHYIGEQPFVLLIDEINVLAKKIGTRLADILKKYFLDKKNRHLVMSTHHAIMAQLDVGEEAEVSTAGQKLWSDS
eukprot:scaffold15402_cov547-Ochromonas_danica.AAC.1